MNKSIASFLVRNLTPLGIEYTYTDVFNERKFIQEEGEVGGWYTFYNYSIDTSVGHFLIAHYDEQFLLSVNGMPNQTGKCIMECLAQIKNIVSGR